MSKFGFKVVSVGRGRWWSRYSSSGPAHKWGAGLKKRLFDPKTDAKNRPYRARHRPRSAPAHDRAIPRTAYGARGRTAHATGTRSRQCTHPWVDDGLTCYNTHKAELGSTDCQWVVGHVGVMWGDVLRCHHMWGCEHLKTGPHP